MSEPAREPARDAAREPARELLGEAERVPAAARAATLRRASSRAERASRSATTWLGLGLG